MPQVSRFAFCGRLFHEEILKVACDYSVGYPSRNRSDIRLHTLEQDRTKDIESLVISCQLCRAYAVEKLIQKSERRVRWHVRGDDGNGSKMPRKVLRFREHPDQAHHRVHGLADIAFLKCSQLSAEVCQQPLGDLLARTYIRQRLHASYPLS